MAWFRRGQTGASPNEIATHAVVHTEGGRAAAIISAIALVFSAFSLWETSLKGTDLKVYVTDTVSYGRDASGGIEAREAGGHEVLVVPVTIANGGARDGAVLALRLDVMNAATGETQRFEGAYTADAAFFGASGNAAADIRRPKAPFAPLVIAGRSAWSGTVLFYPADYGARKLIMPKGRVEMTLTPLSPPPGDWLERMLGSVPRPISLALDAPDFSAAYLVTGEFARLRSSTARL